MMSTGCWVFDSCELMQTASQLIECVVTVTGRRFDLCMLCSLMMRCAWWLSSFLSAGICNAIHIHIEFSAAQVASDACHDLRAAPASLLLCSR